MIFIKNIKDTLKNSVISQFWENSSTWVDSSNESQDTNNEQIYTNDYENIRSIVSNTRDMEANDPENMQDVDTILDGLSDSSTPWTRVGGNEGGGWEGWVQSWGRENMDSSTPWTHGGWNEGGGSIGNNISTNNRA